MQSNPEAFVVVVGCYAQLKPAEIAQIEGVDLVLAQAKNSTSLPTSKGAQKSEKPAPLPERSRRFGLLFRDSQEATAPARF